MKDDIIILAIVALAAYLFWRDGKSETEKVAEQEADGQEEEHTFLLGCLPSPFVGPFRPIPKPRPTITIGNITVPVVTTGTSDNDPSDADKPTDIGEKYDYDSARRVNQFIRTI